MEVLKESKIIIENDFYRYYHYDKFIFPAAFIRKDNRKYLKVVTVMTEEMIEGRFDKTLERYVQGALQ